MNNEQILTFAQLAQEFGTEEAVIKEFMKAHPEWLATGHPGNADITHLDMLRNAFSLWMKYERGR